MNLLHSKARVGVVGASGLVGEELLGLLEAAGLPPGSLQAWVSPTSPARDLRYGEGVVRACPLPGALKPGSLDLLFLCASAEVSEYLRPTAEGAARFIVDCSSRYRLDAGVPLVVPEINGDRLDVPDVRFVASPNCTTTLVALALEPLRRAFGLTRISVASYQAISGAGRAARDALLRDTRTALEHAEGVPALDPSALAFNVFSHDSSVDPASGFNGEERKLVQETRRLFEQPTLEVHATCMRVPTLRAHVAAIQFRLGEPATEPSLRTALGGSLGLELVDDREGGQFPTAVAATGRHEILVGRLRPASLGADPLAEHEEWALLVAGDQLLKGAALNAFQVGEALVQSRTRRRGHAY